MTLSLTWLADWRYFYFWHQRATQETCDLKEIWSEWWGDMTRSKKYLPTNIPNHLPTYPLTSLTEHPKGAILETCDLWDTDHNSDNWEPEYMKIFVTWLLRLTLDSICNSCYVYFVPPFFAGLWNSTYFSTLDFSHLCPWKKPILRFPCHLSSTTTITGSRQSW